MKFTDDQLMQRFDYLKSQRSVIEGHWQELAKYALPERLPTLIKSTPGEKFDPTIYDSTLMHAVEISAAGFHGYLTDPSSRWFALRTEMEGSNVREWLAEVEQVIFDTLNSSNFNEQIHEDYRDMFGFGTSILYEQESLGKRSLVSFHCRPPSEIFLCEDEEGNVDTVYRYFTLTARQAYKLFSEQAGTTVMNHINAGNTEEEVEFLHIVLPREERNIAKRDKLNMPFASLWFDYSLKNKVGEGGYEEFPFLVSRFSKTSGHSYGYSPSMIALPEAKMVSSMRKTTLKAAQKLVDPPIILPSDGYILPFRQTPGAVNMRTTTATGEKLEVMEIPHQLPIGLEMEDRCRATIMSIMFADLFLMLAQLKDQQRTAREITERVNERMIILSPVLGRVMKSKLAPAIIRTFNILWRNGKIPFPPPEARGAETTIEFVSPLALAQKKARAGMISELIMVLLGMAKSLPRVLDMVNVEKTGREIAKTFNLENLLRDEKELQAIWQAKDMAARKAEELNKMEQSSEIVAKLAKGGKEVSTVGQEQQ